MKGYGPDQNLKNDGLTRNNEELKRENETLKQENSRLQQVIQEVTAVNKRWQRYNTDRRMYVQKLLATIQELQEQMNQRGELVLQRLTPTVPTSGTGTAGTGTSHSTGESPGLNNRHYDEHMQLLQLQIKSYRDDWQVEHREKKRILQEKDELAGQVSQLTQEVTLLRKMMCSNCTPNTPTIHIASQDFTPRSAYQTSFQVPISPGENISGLASEGTEFHVEEESRTSTSDDIKTNKWTESFESRSSQSESGSERRGIYLGYPSADGLATVMGFPTPPYNREMEVRMAISGDCEGRQTETEPVEPADSITCPNCRRVFPQSRRNCFIDHFDFCRRTD